MIGKRLHSTSFKVVDLTESDLENVTELQRKELPQDDCLEKEDCPDEIQVSRKQDVNTLKRSSGDSLAGNLRPKQSNLDSQTQQLKWTNDVQHHPPTLKLRQLPFPETCYTQIKAPMCLSRLSKDCIQMSGQPRLPDSNNGEPECINNFNITNTSNDPHMESSLDEFPSKVIGSLVRLEQDDCVFTSQQSPADSVCSDKEGSVATSKEHTTRDDETEDVCLFMPMCSPTCPTLSQGKPQGSLQKEVVCSNLEQLQLNRADSGQSTQSPATGLNPSIPFDNGYLSDTSHMSPTRGIQGDSTSTAENTAAENTSEEPLEEFKVDEALNSPDRLHGSNYSESLLSFSNTQDTDNESLPGTLKGDPGNDSPVTCLWQEWSDRDQVEEESRFNMNVHMASSEDRHFVCSVTLKKIMSGSAQTLVRTILSVFILYMFCQSQ